MNPFIDTVVLIAFVLFLLFIFRGYHLSKMEQRGELDDKDEL